MFEIKDLSKQYETEFVLRDITMQIGKGMNFIVGASGSGKTTLLKILCGMEQNFKGNVTYMGKKIKNFTDQEKSCLYNKEFGFVWQDFHLIEDATVIENMLLPTYFEDTKQTKEVQRLLKLLKLEDVKNNKVKYLSGGQKQRTAIARELMKNPQVIFCDEPTSALDAQSSRIVMDTLRTLSKKKTVIIVTHDTSLINEHDSVYELYKGELIVAAKPLFEKQVYKEKKQLRLSVQNAFHIACMNIKNRKGHFCVSILTLIVAGTLLLTTLSGVIGKSGQNEFNKLIETYGEGILDIGLVGNFISASGTSENDDRPNGDVNQDLNGLYEKYQNDNRIEYIITMQPFENIQVTMDQKTYSIEKTGNSPVLTKLVAGKIPNDDAYQVVVPLNFVTDKGLTPDSILGKNIQFSATIFQWIDNQPIEKPIQVNAKVCGVADNSVVYDYEGNQYSYTVDDSFFFNASAIREVRKQAGIENKSANFTMRAKTPEDLISLKDELNQNGIVPLGRFELVEDIVRLNQQTVEQSGTVGSVIGILAVSLVIIIAAMTAYLRKREYAIYKVSGYSQSHLMMIALLETICSAFIASCLMIICSPLLNIITQTMFSVSILTLPDFIVGVIIIISVSSLSFVAKVPSITKSSVLDMTKSGDKG